MPIVQTYYLNGPDLLSSTAVFLDLAQTICAPDGFYSDGTNVREQFNCTLLPTQQCIGCGEDCFAVGTPMYSQVGGKGIYKATINVGTGTGAIIVEFAPGIRPDGITVEYDNVLYDTLSVQNFVGPVFSAIGPPTFFGDISQCKPPITESLSEFQWNGVGFGITPITTGFTMLTGNEFDTNNDPGVGIMVIPKLSPTPQIIELTMYTMCQPGEFSFAVRCPELLTPIFSTPDPGPPIGGELVTCDLTPDHTYYVAFVNGNQALSQLGYYDWVFTDPYGQNLLADGWYNAPIHLQALNQRMFRVANGIVVEFANTCSPASFQIAGKDLYTANSGCTGGGITSADVKIYWQPLNTLTFNQPVGTNTTIPLESGVYTVDVVIDFDIASVGCNDIEVALTLLDNSFAYAQSQTYTPVAGGQIIFTYQFYVVPGNSPYLLTINLLPA